MRDNEIKRLKKEIASLCKEARKRWGDHSGAARSAIVFLEGEAMEIFPEPDAQHAWTDNAREYMLQEDGTLCETTNEVKDFRPEVPKFVAREVLRLRTALRALAEPLVKAASGSLEGPDIEEILEKAGLIAWTIYDPFDPVHRAAFLEFEVDAGDRVWLLTDFGKEVLGHG